jgi:hypothetical protein
MNFKKLFAKIAPIAKAAAVTIVAREAAKIVGKSPLGAAVADAIVARATKPKVG